MYFKNVLLSTGLSFGFLFVVWLMKTCSCVKIKDKSSINIILTQKEYYMSKLFIESSKI